MTPTPPEPSTDGGVNGQIQTIPMLVKFYDNGLIEYCNPQTEEVLFTKQTASGKSPIVSLDEHLFNSPLNNHGKRLKKYLAKQKEQL